MRGGGGNGGKIVYPSEELSQQLSDLNTISLIEYALPTMPTKVAVKTDKAPPPLPFFSQAIVCNGMVYCSGSIGTSPTTKALVEGGVGERTVGDPDSKYLTEGLQ